MTLLEITTIAQTFDQYIKDGLHDSAARFLVDTVPKYVLRPFKLGANTKYLAHYTSIDALFSILSCPIKHDSQFALSTGGAPETPNKSSGFLRMYDTFNSNDPNEGQFFVSSSRSHNRFSSQHPVLWTLIVERTRLPAYVASFRAVSRLKDVDDLVFWRTYGKNGQGCAIVFPVSFFTADTPAMQVQYGRQSVQLTLDNLSNVFNSLTSVKSLRNSAILTGTDSLPKYISLSLSPIPYLHKSKNYKYESEVRVVVPYADLAPKSLFCHRIHDIETGSKLRHFANLKALHIDNILRTDSFIMLGPAVTSKPNLMFVLEKRLANLGLVGSGIISSTIEYRI